MNGSAYPIFLFSLVALIWMVRSIQASRNDRLDDPRPGIASSARALGTQIALLGMIAWAWDLGFITAAGIGLSFTFSCLIYGWLGWLVVQVAASILKQFDRAEYGVREYVRFQRFLWPRSRVGRWGMVAFLALNPITEEVICRGVLVVMLGKATGSWILALWIGLVVNLANHLYQGVRSLPIHAVYFAVFAFLSLSEAGLGAAIVCHLFADLAGVFNARQYKEWVRLERVRRRAPARA